ncbi:ABC transporter ATP-binding protein [bacterium]|nr:ABC transporter ATP-binding protein [bacterium]
MRDVNAPVVRARNLTKRYGPFLAVDHIDFDIRPGECFGLLGPNGAGKSTTIKMLHCFFPPSEGELSLFGLPAETHAREIKARMGVCGQEPSLDPDLSVLQNLVVFARYFNNTGREARRRAEQLLAFISLSHKKNAPIVSLSGGMKRRLQIARALLSDPQLVILDEPTTGLDPQSRHQVWDRISHLKMEGKTILLTTHYMDEAETLCDRLLIMDHGKILEEGTPPELIARHVGGWVIEIVHPTLEVRAWLSERGLAFEETSARAVLHPPDAEALFHALRQRFPGCSCSLRRATLEDVFLKLTGRELRE